MVETFSIITYSYQKDQKMDDIIATPMSLSELANAYDVKESLL